MKPDPLDDLLGDYAQQPLPSAPSDLTAGVRREIAQRRNRSFWTRVMPLLDWHEFFGEPRLAIPALVCALAIGILPAVVSAKSRADQRLARQSIHFDVFSSQAAPQFAHLVSDRVLPPRSAP